MFNSYVKLPEGKHFLDHTHHPLLPMGKIMEKRWDDSMIRLRGIVDTIMTSMTNDM
jgi:hypothetical protein